MTSLNTNTTAANEKRMYLADRFALDIYKFIDEVCDKETKSSNYQTAIWLNVMGKRGRHGGLWDAYSVSKLYRRVGNIKQ